MSHKTYCDHCKKEMPYPKSSAYAGFVRDQQQEYRVELFIQTGTCTKPDICDLCAFKLARIALKDKP